MPTYAFNPFTGALTPALPGPTGPIGPAGTTGSKLLDEMTAITANGSFSVGTAGEVPFGVGPVAPPGAAFYYLGPDAYYPIHLASGSFC